MPGKTSYKQNKIKNFKQKTINNNISVSTKQENHKIETIAGKKQTKQNNITLAGYCAVCWNYAQYYCPECSIVGYCCLSHMAKHWLDHQSLCEVIQKTKHAGLLFGSNVSTPDEWRFTRVKTLETLKKSLQRNVDVYERDLLLFPKHCSCCYETKIDKLAGCNNCRQVWHCRNIPEHQSKTHLDWCAKLQLFAKLVRKQAKGKLYMFDMNFGSPKFENLQLNTNDNIAKAIRAVLPETADNLDACKIAMISQSASGPLTILYAIRISNFTTKRNLTIHLIGAELHYEGNTLQSWESFFMHFVPEIEKLKIIMVGPELYANATKETIKLCENCRAKNKLLCFEYKDGLLYHEYASSKDFVKPDLVCAFNPGLHRSTGFNQNDTWPLTIQAAVSQNAPFIFTAYTSYEAPLDLKRVQDSVLVHVVHGPKPNPFASLKPDRNFISDHEAPLIFKNYYLSIVTLA